MGLHTVFDDISNCTGYILSHEHIFCDFTPLTGDLDHLLNDKHLALRELTAFEKIGGAVIVDITPPDLGRNPHLLADLAEQTPLKIIMATGWYRKAFYPSEIDGLTSVTLSKIMMKELQEGILLHDGRRVKAGIIGEIGVDRDSVSALEERVLRIGSRIN